MAETVLGVQRYWLTQGGKLWRRTSSWRTSRTRESARSPKREEAFRKLCEKLGAKVKDAYRTMGRYDVAAIVDAPDDVTMNAILYSLGALGNVRTETLRAFTRQETDAAVAKMA